jgi:hypothetical protein
MDNPKGMRLARTLLNIFVAVAVAMVPISAGVALAGSQDVSMGAHEADCCPHKTPCQKKVDDCGSFACVIKCLGSTAFLASAIGFLSVLSAKTMQAVAYAGLDSNLTAPPLPPPRI